MQDFDYSGYYALATVIVAEAVRDYKKALKSRNENRIYQEEEILKSRYIRSLTNLDMDYVIETLKKEKNYGTRKTDSRRFI